MQVGWCLGGGVRRRTKVEAGKDLRREIYRVRVNPSLSLSFPSSSLSLRVHRRGSAPAALAAGALTGWCRDDLGCRPALYSSSFRFVSARSLGFGFLLEELPLVLFGVLPAHSPRRSCGPAARRAVGHVVRWSSAKFPWWRKGGFSTLTTTFFNKRFGVLGLLGAALLLAGLGGEGEKGDVSDVADVWKWCWQSSKSARPRQQLPCDDVVQPPL